MCATSMSEFDAYLGEISSKLKVLNPRFNGIFQEIERQNNATNNAIFSCPSPRVRAEFYCYISLSLLTFAHLYIYNTYTR